MLFIKTDGTRETLKDAVAIKETPFNWVVTYKNGETKTFSAYYWTLIK